MEERIAFLAAIAASPFLVLSADGRTRESVNRIKQFIFGFAIIAMATTAVSDAYARALFAYPMKGQTLEQEDVDRAACHDWAVVQTGYDPTYLYAAQQGMIVVQTKRDTLPTSDRRYPAPPGSFAEVRGRADIRRLNELYDAYLRAGEVCLEARGYEVSR
jgi:hypothetical protein